MRSREAAGRGGGEREVNLNVSLRRHGAVSSGAKEQRYRRQTAGRIMLRVTPVDVAETQAATLLNHHQRGRSGRALTPLRSSPPQTGDASIRREGGSDAARV